MARTKRVSSRATDPPTPSKVRIVQRAQTVQAENGSSPMESSQITLPHRTPEPAENARWDITSENMPSSPPLPSAQIHGNGAAQSLQTPENLEQAENPLSGDAGEEVSLVSNSTPVQFASGVEVLSRGVKKLMNATSDLRDLGIERFMTLPKICVVGDQSTGKSSLIEGISGIKVPRGEDTTTRCPLEIILREEKYPWQCSITIVKKYVYEPSSQYAGVGSLGPWHEQSTEKVHFEDVSSKIQLVESLHRAQLAILNPAVHPDTYRTPNIIDDHKRQVPFSPNIIRLCISGQGTPNLSFYDLPGVVVQDKQQHVPALIQALVEKYIAPPNSLILYTMPMNNDFANSNTGRLIREIPHAVDRTLGVVTKPDTLVRNNVSQWRDILNNRGYHQMGFGYFVVKNEIDTDVDHQIARENEVAFFDANPIFRKELSSFKDRFGTTKLQEFLSSTLTSQISKNLPAIGLKIDGKIESAEKRLALLPQPPRQNMILAISNKVTELARHLELQIQGSSSKEDFFNVWRAGALEFRNRLVQSYPEVLFSSTVKTPKANPAPQTPRKVNDMSTPGRNGSQKQDAIAIEDSDEESSQQQRIQISGPKRIFSPEARNPTPSFAASPRKRIDPKNRTLGTKITLHEIQSRINAASRGFPGAFDPRVIESLYSDSTTHWRSGLTDFMDCTRTVCENLLGKAHEEVLREFADTALSKRIWEVVTSFLAECLERHKAMVNFVLDLELGRPLTINEVEFSERKNALEDEICKRWRKVLLIEQLALKEAQGQGKKLGHEERRVIEVEIENTPNCYKLEMAAMAATRAYYECCAKRFSDYCHTLMAKSLFEELRSGLPTAILDSLELHKTGANETLRDMAEISPQIAEERKQCEDDLSALRQAKARLDQLITNGTTPDDPPVDETLYESGDVEMN